MNKALVHEPNTVFYKKLRADEERLKDLFLPKLDRKKWCYTRVHSEKKEQYELKIFKAKKAQYFEDKKERGN
jgi:hypothetical protein